MTINARCKVLEKDGNRFTFTSLIDFYNDPDRKSATDFWAASLGLSMALGAELEKDWLEFDQNNFTNVKGEIISNVFMHGAATAIFISGTIFDEAMAEKEELKNADNK